jgi:RNA polymerase sigma-54 factor
MMVAGPRLQLRQSAALALTPQMRQAIALLQMSNLELGAAVAEQVERNPLLDLAEAPAAAIAPTVAATDRPRGAGQATPAGPTVPEAPAAISETLSLHDHLRRQLSAIAVDATESMIGDYLIGMLDDAGYLRTTAADAAAELGSTPDQVASVLDRLQRFEPAGLFARDLAECLALQLRERGRLDPAMRRLVDNLDLVAAGDRRALLRTCAVDDEDLDDMVAEIRALDPKPGLAFGAAQPATAVPDVIVAPAPTGGWQIELNGDTLPRLIINNAYRAHISNRGGNVEQKYLTECFSSASWLIKALHQRAETILKVASEIVRRQEGFLDDGVSGLRPLVMREVADAVGLHESTISRATSGKYMATPRGTFELKYFFSSAIAGTDGGDARSGEVVRHRIRELIEDEDPGLVLSDDRIAEILKSEGVAIARRTVAKYRESLGIGSSAARRRALRMGR